MTDIKISAGADPGPLLGTDKIPLARAPSTTSFAATMNQVVAFAGAPTFNNVGRNLIHNPLFNVAQRGVGPWATLGIYTSDRWFQNGSLDAVSFSVVTVTDADRAQIGDETAGLTLQNVFTGNAGASAYDFAVQYIESARRLCGKTVTASFWARATVGSPKLGVNIYQSFGTGGSSAGGWVNATGQSVTLTGTFTRYSMTFTIPSAAGKTFGTNANDSHGLSFFFSSGATNNAAAGNIGVQSGTIQLWGVQLEVGTVATPLEKPDPQQDLAKCQRFYQTGAFALQGYTPTAAVTVGYEQSLPVTMRAAPTVAIASETNAIGMGARSIAADSPTQIRPNGASGANGGFSWTGAFTASADL